MKVEELENSMYEETTHVWFLWGRISGLKGCFLDEDEAYNLAASYGRSGLMDAVVYECRYWKSGWSIWCEGRPWHKPSPVPVRSAWGFETPEKAIAAFCALDSEVIAAFHAGRKASQHTSAMPTNWFQYPTPGDWRRTLEGK